MQLLADVASAIEDVVPVAQEFYLFFFFCLGFVIFRSETAKRLLCIGAPRNSKCAEKGGAQLHSSVSWHTVDHLQSNFEHKRYDQVLESWAVLETYTGEALALVVRALLALHRPDDVGLVVAKAAANLPHLKASLHDLIVTITTPTEDVPPPAVALALYDLFEKARDLLDVRGVNALLSALAHINDERRVGELLREQAAKFGRVSTAALVNVSQGFAHSRNLAAALGYLQQLFANPGSTGSAGAVREATMSIARVTTADVAESSANPEGTKEHARPHALDLAELLEGVVGDGDTGKASLVPSEAITLLLEWMARRPDPDIRVTERLAMLLRRTAKPTRVPAGALDALVRLHAGPNGEQAKALAYFEELKAQSPTEGSLVGMLSACATSKNAEIAEHILAWSRGCQRCSLPVFSATIKVFAVAKLPESVCAAYEASEGLPGLDLDTAAFGLIIKSAVQAGRTSLARKLYTLAENPDAQNSVSLIRACGQEGNVAQALELLADLQSRGEADVPAFNAALDVAVSAGDHQAAAHLFAQMKAVKKVDVVSFNILLKQQGGPLASMDSSFAVVEDMIAYGLRPNVSTFNSLLGPTLAAGNFGVAWKIVDRMEKGPGIDAYTLSILFKGYKGRRTVMSSGAFDRAMNLLEKYSVRVDEVLVNVTLEACVGLRDPSRLSAALQALKRSGWTLPKQCGGHTVATLIKAYGMTRQLNICWKLWGEAGSRGVPSEQIYGQMIDVLVSNGRLEEALGLLTEMKAKHGVQGFQSQGFAVAYAMVIRGFAQQRDCHRALQCYEEIKEHKVKVGLVVFNTLVDACCRVGDMDAAGGIFRDMVDADCVPDLISYSTLIKGHCVRGDVEKAVELFALMQGKGIQPDAIVFNSLLDGCAKKQLPKLCEQVIHDMEQAGVSPSNHSASILIKLYGRCRDLDAAFRVLEEMPRKYGFRANAAVYTCLMSTCIGNSRLDLALDLRRRMIKEGERLDERTYSTLLRGVLRAGNAQQAAELLRAALEQSGGARSLLDEELTQNALTLLQRCRGREAEALELYMGLRQAGLTVRCPGGVGAARASNLGEEHKHLTSERNSHRYSAPVQLRRGCQEQQREQQQQQRQQQQQEQWLRQCVN